MPVKDELGTFDVHFAALFSSKQDAIPIIMLHGWPGNFTEFLDILRLLKKQYSPEKLLYHIVIPSLPGYTFSKMSGKSTDFSQTDCARVMNTLMTDILGFKSYIVQAPGRRRRLPRRSCHGRQPLSLHRRSPQLLQHQPATPGQNPRHNLRNRESWLQTLGNLESNRHSLRPRTRHQTIHNRCSPRLKPYSTPSMDR